MLDFEWFLAPLLQCPKIQGLPVVNLGHVSDLNLLLTHSVTSLALV